MAFKEFKLTKKINLTNDVYELHLETNEEIVMKPWQFITFILPIIGWRAYSILESIWNKIILLIKKWELEQGWRWGSKYICEREIWEVLKWVWPSWHFVLKENNENKLFLWTWTGLVPLYNQIIFWLKNSNSKYKLIFWVRTFSDLFYAEKLEELKNNFSNFSYEIYISREEKTWLNKGYVTDFLNSENISEFSEFYICWMPNMISSSVEILKNNWISDEKIFFEKY